MFDCEHENVTPDTLWKKASGGMDKATLHTSSFDSNTMAAAAGLATLEVLYTEILVEEAKDKGEFIIEKLRELKRRFPLIKEVRGNGLMIGIEFNHPDGLRSKTSLGITKKLSREFTASLSPLSY